jgi:hypothetical protein
VGLSVVINQSFAGLVLQFFQGGSSDAANGLHVSFGFEVAGTFTHDLELNFSHQHPWLLAVPSLAHRRCCGGGAEYGEPACWLRQADHL